MSASLRREPPSTWTRRSRAGAGQRRTLDNPSSGSGPTRGSDSRTEGAREPRGEHRRRARTCQAILGRRTRLHGACRPARAAPSPRPGGRRTAAPPASRAHPVLGVAERERRLVLQNHTAPIGGSEVGMRHPRQGDSKCQGDEGTLDQQARHRPKVPVGLDGPRAHLHWTTCRTPSASAQPSPTSGRTARTRMTSAGSGRRRVTPSWRRHLRMTSTSQVWEGRCSGRPLDVSAPPRWPSASWLGSGSSRAGPLRHRRGSPG